jgi:hypothetical protein
MSTLHKLQNELKKLQQMQKKAHEVNNSHEETLLNALRKKNGPECSLSDITSSPSPSREHNNNNDDNQQNSSSSSLSKKSLLVDDYLLSGVVISEPELVALISRIDMSKKQIEALGKMIFEKQNAIDEELNKQKVEEVD